MVAVRGDVGDARHVGSLECGALIIYALEQVCAFASEGEAARRRYGGEVARTAHTSASGGFGQGLEHPVWTRQQPTYQIVAVGGLGPNPRVHLQIARRWARCRSVRSCPTE